MDDIKKIEGWRVPLINPYGWPGISSLIEEVVARHEGWEWQDIQTEVGILSPERGPSYTVFVVGSGYLIFIWSRLSRVHGRPPSSPPNIVQDIHTAAQDAFETYMEEVKANNERRRRKQEGT